MKSQYNVSLRFLLDQKNEKDVLENIRNLIGHGKVVCRDKDIGKIFRYSLHSLKNNKIIINYFNKFALKTTKNSSFDI
jgi:hypothetical protein